MKQTFYILAEMDDRDIDWLLNSGRYRNLSANSNLIYQGSPPNALYIILEGHCAVRVRTDNTILDLAEVGPGDIVGEMSFVDTRHASADVVAKEDVLTWAIPWTKLSSKLYLDNSFAAHFYHALATLMADRMRTLHSQLDMTKLNKINVEQEDDLSPQVLKRLELVKARFDYLMYQLKSKNTQRY